MGFSRSIVLGCLFVAMLSTAGCADSPAGGASAIAVVPINQQWTLSRVGAWGVPVSIEVQSGVSRQISAGSINLRDDWTWSFAYEHHDTGMSVDRTGTFTAWGTYAVYGGDPTVAALRDESTGQTLTATINADNTVDLVLGGLTYHFVSK